ncbi:MAG: universal stress protein [Alphaproteobacteria bacterium]|nr:universal stress protein [Alphaproteobacteria bacterium]
MSAAETAVSRKSRTKFLVVVDDTPECRVALRFAARRARRLGSAVVMLRVIEPTDFKQWGGVEELMREEARAEAEQLLQDVAAQVNQAAGLVPEFVVKEGRKRDVVLDLIKSDAGIRILVLGAAAGESGPGPLVASLAGQMSGQLPIPVTVVPGSLTDAQIDDLS